MLPAMHESAAQWLPVAAKSSDSKPRLSAPAIVLTQTSTPEAVDRIWVQKSSLLAVTSAVPL